MSLCHRSVDEKRRVARVSPQLANPWERVAKLTRQNEHHRSPLRKEGIEYNKTIWNGIKRYKMIFPCMHMYAIPINQALFPSILEQINRYGLSWSVTSQKWIDNCLFSKSCQPKIDKPPMWSGASILAAALRWPSLPIAPGWYHMISPCSSIFATSFKKVGYQWIPFDLPLAHHHPNEPHPLSTSAAPFRNPRGGARTVDLSVVTFIMDALADREGFTNSQFERCKKSFEHFDVNGDPTAIWKGHRWDCEFVGKFRRNSWDCW